MDIVFLSDRDIIFCIMQLFILDRDPFRAVEMLADVHVVKMCLETAQILSSVLSAHNKKLFEAMPKPYNVRHPVITALDSAPKINYTLFYNSALHDEFLYRFGRKHKYYELAKVYFEFLFEPSEFADWSFCRNFKGIEIKNPDIVEAYREYYVFKKSVIRRWHYTNRKEPDFLL